MTFSIKTAKGKDRASFHFMRALACFVSFIAIVALPSVFAFADTYIYKDSNGVYRSTDKEPRKRKSMKAETHTDGVSKEEGVLPVLERLNEFCNNVAGLEFPELVSFYREDSSEIRSSLLNEKLSTGDIESALEKLDDCATQLEDRASEIRKREQSQAAKANSLRRQEKSYEQLQSLIKKRLDERRRSGVTIARERFATPVEIQRMTSLLRLEMHSKDVRYYWGRPLWINGEKGGSYEAWRYPLGIELIFSNNKLKHWRTYK